MKSGNKCVWKKDAFMTAKKIKKNIFTKEYHVSGNTLSFSTDLLNN